MKIISSWENWIQKNIFHTEDGKNYSKFWIIALIFLTFIPFMNTRMSRTAGDDKVYVAQALEMERNNTWFIQTLGDEPDYRKGMVHYFFLRIGYIVFGKNMLSSVYMNLLLMILAGLAMAALVARHLESGGWAIFCALALSLNAGVYSHAFASQMEVELVCLFLIGLYFLDRAKPGKRDLYFWLMAGLAGAVKSPLHAGMMGATAILFWIWQKEFVSRLKNIHAWWPMICGVLFCLATYLPPVLFDYENFMGTFMGRENFEKGSNGAPWHYPIIPIFTYSLMPWMFLAFIAFADGIIRLVRKSSATNIEAGGKRLISLGVCLCIPSIAFFLMHPYRGQNYNLPIIGGLILIIATLCHSRAKSWTKFYSISIWVTTAFLLAIPALITIIARHFEPMPFWWSSLIIPVLWVGALISTIGFWRETFIYKFKRPEFLAAHSIWFFMGVSLFLSNIGEREMLDVRLLLDRYRANGKQIGVSYYNLHKNVWSEWGYLNLMIPAPVRGLHDLDDLIQSYKDRDLFLIPGEERLGQFKQHLEAAYPSMDFHYDINIWRRWKTKGKNRQGIPVWKDAWLNRDLSLIEKHYYMVMVDSSPKDSP